MTPTRVGVRVIMIGCEKESSKPARTKKLGVEAHPPRSGSHWKLTRGSAAYPIPAHNGPRTEIDDAYIRGLCAALGLDEKELRALL